MAGRGKRTQPRVGFVLGGGGLLGTSEVGMLAALLDKGIVPDLIVGTSIGALNGAAVAAEPSTAAIERLRSVWLTLGEERVFGESPFASAANLLRQGTHLHSNRPLRRLIERYLPATFEDLRVPFQCVAANVERAAEHWFYSGPLADAILASTAVPGLLPAVKIGDEHFMDGGLVNSIPVSRAVELGATEIYVLHVGRINGALRAPRTMVQVAAVTFEIARRHRFARDMASLPPGVVAHVLPTGEQAPRYDSLAQLRYRDFRSAARRIDRARRATAEYLEGIAG